MDNIGVKLLQSYKQLVDLFQEQIKIAEMERYDDQLDQIKLLEQNKISHKVQINSLREEASNYDLISSDDRIKVSSHINELKILNQQLQDILDSWYSENSSSMKQVSSHRRTLHAYGGVNQSDVISYFIDDKK